MSAPGNTRHPGIAAAMVGVADLTIKNDVVGELAIRPAAMMTMEHIADHGGEIRFSWEGLTSASREMVADLIMAGYVVEREHVTHMLQVSGPLSLKLTDKGRNVVTIHRKRKIVATDVKPLDD